MSHAIDIDGLRKEIFILRNVALAREFYGQEERYPDHILSEGGYGDGFSGLLKGLLSNTIIDACVKLRIIQEYCNREELKVCEDSAVRGLVYGKVLEGSFKWTLRESFNKVIHSERVLIEFVQLPFSSAGCWDGKILLRGKQGVKHWEVELYVSDWAKAIYRYIDQIEENGLIEKLGI